MQRPPGGPGGALQQTGSEVTSRKAASRSRVSVFVVFDLKLCGVAPAAPWWRLQYRPLSSAALASAWLQLLCLEPCLRPWWDVWLAVGLSVGEWGVRRSVAGLPQIIISSSGEQLPRVTHQCRPLWPLPLQKLAPPLAATGSSPCSAEISLLRQRQQLNAAQKILHTPGDTFS